MWKVKVRWGGCLGLGPWQDGSFVARLGDVRRLPRGDLRPCLAGAPKHPTDLAQMHLRGVQQEEEEEEEEEGEGEERKA